MDADVASDVARARRPDPRSVSGYYHHGVFDVVADLWDGSLHYGLWRGEDDRSTVREAMDAMTMEMIRRLDPKPGDRVLDVGCGDGTPALMLAREREVEVVGITVSDRQVARATERARRYGLSDRVRFEQADAASLPYDEGSFDSAWALQSLCHMPDRARAVAEIVRVLRPGANLPIADRIYLDAPARPAPSAIEEYQVLLERAGLEVKDVCDVSRETARTSDAFADDLATRRDELIALIGVEGYELLMIHQRALGRTPELGYVLIGAYLP